MRTVRRYLVLVALMFWLGGFTFYASIVVPAGTDVLGSAVAQGQITREVTRRLNLAALVALVPLLWDVVAGGDPSRARRAVRLGLWAFMLGCQVLLFTLHGRLDGLMRLEEAGLLDDAASHPAFHPTHRLYLWTHTFQWAAGLLYMAFMLRAWQGEVLAAKSPESTAAHPRSGQAPPAPRAGVTARP
jgi:hypothetical protein